MNNQDNPQKIKLPCNPPKVNLRVLYNWITDVRTTSGLMTKVESAIHVNRLDMEFKKVLNTLDINLTDFCNVKVSESPSIPICLIRHYGGIALASKAMGYCCPNLPELVREELIKLLQIYLEAISSKIELKPISLIVKCELDLIPSNLQLIKNQLESLDITMHNPLHPTSMLMIIDWCRQTIDLDQHQLPGYIIQQLRQKYFADDSPADDDFVMYRILKRLLSCTPDYYLTTQEYHNLYRQHLGQTDELQQLQRKDEDILTDILNPTLEY